MVCNTHFAHEFFFYTTGHFCGANSIGRAAEWVPSFCFVSRLPEKSSIKHMLFTYNRTGSFPLLMGQFLTFLPIIVNIKPFSFFFLVLLFDLGSIIKSYCGYRTSHFCCSKCTKCFYASLSALNCTNSRTQCKKKNLGKAHLLVLRSLVHSNFMLFD